MKQQESSAAFSGMTACSPPLSQHSHAPTFSSRIASLRNSPSALAIPSLILSLFPELDITSLALVFIFFCSYSLHASLAHVHVVGFSNGISSFHLSRRATFTSYGHWKDQSGWNNISCGSLTIQGWIIVVSSFLLFGDTGCRIGVYVL